MKVQKLSVNTGHGCPNRDGSIGTGGCIYCNNSSFTPGYCFGISGVGPQLEAGKKFFGRKYKDMDYIAYFQSFSSTYGSGLEEELAEALEVEGICGIALGGRPDCLGDDTLSLLETTARRVPVFLEIGVESMHDTTLRLINRGHDSAASAEAIKRAASHGLHVGVHLINGLPRESPEMMLESVRRICDLPVETIKLHHLQVLKGSELHRRIEDGSLSVKPFSMEEYLDLCVKIVDLVPRRICIERFLAQAPPEMVVMPRWGIKNYIFTEKLLKQLKGRHSVNKKSNQTICLL